MIDAREPGPRLIEVEMAKLRLERYVGGNDWKKMMRAPEERHNNVAPPELEILMPRVATNVPLLRSLRIRCRDDYQRAAPPELVLSGSSGQLAHESLSAILAPYDRARFGN